MKNKSILIAVLNQGEIRPEIAEMLRLIERQGKYLISIIYPDKKPISYNRNWICKRFLETDYDYLLMMDGDCPISVNPDKLLDMADYDKDVIGAICFGFINKMIVPFIMKLRDDYRYDVFDTAMNNGVVEVDAIGSGVMMIARRVLENMPHPFRNEYDPEGIKTKGLDFNFCARAKKLGYRVWANTDIQASHWTTIDLLFMWQNFNELLKMAKSNQPNANEVQKSSGYENDIAGWMTPSQVVWLFETAKKMDSIVEIGSWIGRSTHALLSGCKGIVHAIDIFQDNKVALTTGEEQYQQFTKNVGSFKNLMTYRMSSEEGVKRFEDKSIDMVFIDGGHSYENVKKDIELWLPKVKKLICGHDYQGEDVKRAVDEKLGTIENINNIWFKWIN